MRARRAPDAGHATGRSPAPSRQRGLGGSGGASADDGRDRNRDQERDHHSRDGPEVDRGGHDADVHIMIPYVFVTVAVIAHDILR